MAETKVYENIKWDTVHENGPFHTEKIYESKLDRSLPNKLDQYNDSLSEIQKLIEDSIKENKRFRPYGSNWSLSDIAHENHSMHNNASLNLKIPLDNGDLHEKCQTSHSNLYLFQCGNLIGEISKFIKRHKKSLKTSGASNGQTIAGAISTGVHGSTIDFGSIQDSVVGLHLAIGPNPEDSVYLERNSQPICNSDFATKIGARIIRNDGLFNSALIGLGSFGFIFGVVLEVEDIFLLKRYTKRINLSNAIQLAHTLDFQNSDFIIPQEVDANNKPLRPFHFKVYLNPYNEDEELVAEVIYKKPYRNNYPSPLPTVQKYIKSDLTTFIIDFASKYNWLIPTIIDALESTIFPELDEVTEGTLSELFWDTALRGPAFAWAFGINHTDTEKALNILLDLVKEKGPIPGAIALRFVKSTKATLGFTKYPYTCILEMDGLQWSASQDMISRTEFEAELIKAFMEHNISFTIHWGKNASWSYPNLVNYMYDNKEHEWRSYRSALLSDESAELFSNAFLKRVGLSDYIKNADPQLVANISV